MEPYEDHREKSTEELRMEEEELRELQEKSRKKERELLFAEARRRLKSKLKYRFVLSNDGMLFLLVAGGAIAFTLLRLGLVEKLFRKQEAASRSFGIMTGIVFIVLLWLIYSLIMRIFLKKEAEALVDSGTLTLDNLIFADEDDKLLKPQMKKASEVKIEFPVETLESLSEMDFDLAEEEWDRLDHVVTDKFFRMPSFLQSFNGRDVYRVYVELRYEDAYPNYGLLKKTLDEIETALKESHLAPDVQLADFKRKAKNVVRKEMAKSFPYLILQEICIAVKQIA
ncbi:MAG: hypothetical protein IK081_10410 [Lachnospiraceae bacterium]|nr:hypothetical protein [Lachnospiraceae bacterium]